MSKEDIKLVKELPKLNTEETSNFWTTCPAKYEYMPKQHCGHGKPELDESNKIKSKPSCAWWINSPKHNYCFWSFVRDRSNCDGVMDELLQADLARLFGWSNTKAHFILKEATEELIKLLKLHRFEEELVEVAEYYLAGSIDPREVGDLGDD